jgi:hypothetical protein
MDGTQIQSEGPAQWADPSFRVITPHWDIV